MNVEFYVRFVKMSSGKLSSIKAAQVYQNPPTGDSPAHSVVVKMSLDIPDEVFEPLTARPMSITNIPGLDAEKKVLEIAKDLYDRHKDDS